MHFRQGFAGLVSLFFAIAAYGQERVAIMQSLDDQDSIGISDLAYLTDRLRNAAVNALPKASYEVMTTESIAAFLGQDDIKECLGANCLAELGRNVNADYVAQARIGRFGGNFTIKTELYISKNGNLLGSFTGNSKSLQGLRDIIDEKAPTLFKKMQHELAEINAKIKSEEMKEADKKIRFGVRANVGMTGPISKYNVNKHVPRWEDEFRRSKYEIESREDTPSPGASYGLGAFAAIPLFGIRIVPEIHIQHSELISDFYGLTIKESSIQIPLLFRFRYREENTVYLGIGPLMGIIFNVQDNQNGTFKDYRSKIEGGLLMEMGLRISRHFSIDFRYGASSGAGIYLAERYISTDGSSYVGEQPTYCVSEESSCNSFTSFGTQEEQSFSASVIIQLGVNYVF